MGVVDHFKSGWEVVKPTLVPWIVFALIFLVILSTGLGLFLMPNAFRAIRDAVDRQQGPELSDLFDFSNISDDLVAMLVYMVGVTIGSFLCGVGAIPAGVLLFWVPMLAAEGQFGGVECAKASLAHAKANFMAILVFMLVAILINSAASLLCYIPVLVSMPVTFAAQWLYYTRNRDEILAAASAAGVPTKA